MPQQVTPINPDLIPVTDLTVGTYLYERPHPDCSPEVRQVGHAAPYSDPNGQRMVAATLFPLDGGEPILARWRAITKVRPATDAQVDGARDSGRRVALANALYALAGEILHNNLPIPRYTLRISGCVGSREDVQRWADHLGVEIVMGGTERDIPVADLERAVDGGPAINISLQGPSEPKPKPEPLKVEAAIAAAESLERHDNAVALAAAKAAQLGFHRRDLVRVGDKPERWQIEGFQAWSGGGQPVVVYLVNPFDASEGTSAHLYQLRHTTDATVQAGKDCPDAWHTSPVEPTEPCPACGDSAQPTVSLNRTAQAGE